MGKERASNLLAFAQKALVSKEVLPMAQSLIQTGVFCPVREEKLSRLEEGATLFDFQQTFPFLGFCVLSWAHEQGLIRVEAEDVLAALASDFHYRAIRESLPLYIVKYGLDDKEKQDQFLLSHLVVGGQFGREKEKAILFYPSKKERRIVFSLQDDQSVVAGEYGLIHLGQIVLSLGSEDQMVRRLVDVHQSQPQVKKLFASHEGEVIKIFKSLQ